MKSALIKFVGRPQRMMVWAFVIVFALLMSSGAPSVAAQTQAQQTQGSQTQGQQTQGPQTQGQQTQGPQAQGPQQDDPDVRQLRDKLQKLEQTVEELKTQLASIEQAKKTTPGGPSDRASAAPSGETPSVNGNKKQDKDKDSDTTFEVYGFAMLDSGYQFKQNDPNWFDVVRPVKLPSFKDEFAPDGKVFYGVRQSRLGVKSSIPTAFGELKTKFEFELFGTGVDAGQTTFRLRHAWGELKHFGAGQNNSTFMDPDVFPNTIEYWGPNGMILFRNVQIRWMPIIGDNAVSIALERPGASGDQGVFQDRIELTGIRPKFDLPDLTGNVRFTRGWGHLQVSGLVRRIRWIDVQNDQFDLAGTAVGWGVNTSSVVKFGKNDVGRFSVVYGHGVENYFNDAPVDVGIAPTNSTDPSKPIKGVALGDLGVVAYLDHTWNKRFSSSVGYSLVNIENSSLQAANAFHRGHYASGNVLFYPTENSMVGAEFIWGRRENFSDGFGVNDFRLQISFKYNFSKVFIGGSK